MRVRGEGLRLSTMIFIGGGTEFTSFPKFPPVQCSIAIWPEVFLKIPTLLGVVMQISARVLAVSTERTNFNSSSHRDNTVGAAARDDVGNMRGPALVSGDPLRQIGFPVVSAGNAALSRRVVQSRLDNVRSNSDSRHAGRRCAPQIVQDPSRNHEIFAAFFPRFL